MKFRTKFPRLLDCGHHFAYSEDENAFLRSHFRQIETKELARRLGRAVASVLRQARRLGLGLLRQPWTPDRDQELARCLRSGKCFAAIAVRLATTEAAIRKRACRLGLPAEKSRRLSRRAAMRKVRSDRGIGKDSLKAALWRRKAASMGFPGASGPRQVSILQYLAVAGQATRQQVARAFGLPDSAVWKSLKTLCLRGLVASSGGSPRVFRLPAVEVHHDVFLPPLSCDP